MPNMHTFCMFYDLSISKTAWEARMYDPNAKVHKGARHNLQILKTQTCQLFWHQSGQRLSYIYAKKSMQKHVYIDMPKELKKSKDNDLLSIWDWLA